MRIEIDEDLETVLNEIKTSQGWQISGRGHSDTVRFLARYFKEHGEIVKVLQESSEAINETIENSLRQVIKDFVTNLMAPVRTDQGSQDLEKQTESDTGI